LDNAVGWKMCDFKRTFAYLFFACYYLSSEAIARIPEVKEILEKNNRIYYVTLQSRSVFFMPELKEKKNE
jgi:hypothetical protein